MKRLAFCLCFFFGQSVQADCYLEEYERFINTQSLVMLEASVKLFEEDKEKFKIIKPFVKLEVRNNKLKVYVAKKLNETDSAILNLEGPIANYVPNVSVQIMPDGSIRDKVDLAMSGDIFYRTEKSVMAPIQSLYLFHEGMDDREKTDFLQARNSLSKHMETIEQFSYMKRAFTMRLENVCEVNG
ncbi:hypothetical protein MO867_19730 [Microbulbifer sp. OS29]|uniref:Uncharacterized protein n=1 Tax=Microbulbifer okhotskensis TaxID=2926617 RepID=A0A9X2ERN9_9GAMM|nr:hypothetical protein [Microbulbifer okhotskensis]MCO1336566.1 hypothetical protein [Microbulbifer okhotskensis]